jgi:branched-chain amino acid transport system substrate-binding protein
MMQAAQLAIEAHNRAIAPPDLPIVATVVDDAGTPERGAAVAEIIAAEPDILGVVGHYDSDVTIAASNVYARAGLAMITPIASNPLVTDRHLPGVFRWTNRDDRTAIAIAAYLRGARRKRRAVIVESETAYGASMADQFHRAFIAAGGDVPHHQRLTNQIPPDVLIAELPGDFDLLFYGGAFDGAPLLKAMRAAGLMQLFAAGDGCWDVKHFLEPAGPAALAGEGVLVLAATLGVGCMNGSADFASRYTARYGPIRNYALNAYDATNVLLDALNTATREHGRLPTRAAVIDAIAHSHYQGLSYRDPVRWDHHGDNLSSLTALNIIHNGQFTEIAEIAAP